MVRGGWAYMMASRRNGTIYTGVTSNLTQRAWQHREGQTEGFTKKYACNLLVWYERHEEIEFAILREKQFKEWQRKWKLRLIEEMNPRWDDLYLTLAG